SRVSSLLQRRAAIIGPGGASRDSTSSEKLLRMRQLGTRRIGLARQRDELLEVRGGLLAVAGGFSRARSAREAPIAVRVLLERGLELVQRGRGLPTLEQQFAEQLAHRIESVLHRHVLDAAVFAVGGGAHELHPLLLCP